MCVDQIDFFCSFLEGLNEQYQERCRNTVMELWWEVGVVIKGGGVETPVVG